MRNPMLYIIAVLLTAGTANAQVASQKSLTIEGARKVIAAAEAHARTKAGTGVIAVVDAGGNLMAVERLDGTFPAASNISIGKARTAALFRKATRDFEDLVNKGRVTMTTLPEVTPFTPLQGGVPILVGGQVVGAVGVSGAASAKQDDEIAQAAADAFARHQAGQAAAVKHVPSATVEAGYRADANLVRADGFRVRSDGRWPASSRSARCRARSAGSWCKAASSPIRACRNSG